MSLDLRLPVVLAVAGTALPAFSATMNVQLELPRLPVSDYKTPYVAMWLEKPDQSFVANLAVWYDLKKRNNAGTKWLRELRTWWRVSGRETALPADGLSGPTRPPGSHALSFPETNPALAALPAGKYQLVVETAREHGGGELVRVPFEWPPRGRAVSAQAAGSQEIGMVKLEIQP